MPKKCEYCEEIAVDTRSVCDEDGVREEIPVCEEHAFMIDDAIAGTYTQEFN